MGMSTTVKAYISPECPIYKKHSAVLIACMNAQVSLPKETADYFREEFPSSYLLEEKLEKDIPLHEWQDDCSLGYEILMSEIPEGVYKLRFYNSW